MRPTPPLETRRGERWTVAVDALPTAADVFAHSIARGLSDHPRWLHCRYLYDEAGSGIFVEITRQPEYYLTRAEREILAAHADTIREHVGPVRIVELGAGTASKTRVLLDAWARAAADAPVVYVPIDIDASVLTAAADALTRESPTLEVRGFATSYERGLELVADGSPLCLVFLGSTIGNFNPDETEAFLRRVERTLAPGDTFLLGVDLVKDVATLEAAYNDAAGWSEAFTRNLFRRMNRELGTAVPPDSVDHVAYWNDRLERIEIYARFSELEEIELRSIGRRFRLARGEMVLTEISRKYRIEKIAGEMAAFGLRLEGRFTDAGEKFALLLFRRITAGDLPPEWMRIAGEIQRVRRATQDLIESLGEEELRAPALPILSPIAWDLAHIAEFEEQWLVRAIDARLAGKPLESALASEYDAAKTPRRERAKLDLPDRRALLDRLREVRAVALERLRRVPLHGDPILEDGFVYRMLAQHETQHQETILQAVARMDVVYEPATRGSVRRAELPPDTEMVVVPAGAFPMGSPRDAWAYDNETPVHWVEQGAFWIDAAPVTNGAFRAFVEAGGYEHRAWWSDEGWAWRATEEIRHPLGWRRPGTGWEEIRFGRREPLDENRPVMHVSWYEADAFARSVGKRLPTEAEWEKAAAWDPELRIARRWPWGDTSPAPRLANLNARSFAAAPVGAYPAGRSFYGCHQLIGDVWEWTSSDFAPYPGFAAFPYPEYSENHFGQGYKVLRGGSWATAGIVARNTFRNWDYPQRRQIFAGLRCARSA